MEYIEDLDLERLELEIELTVDMAIESNQTDNITIKGKRANIIQKGVIMHNMTIKYYHDNEFMVFYITYKGAKVELLRAKPEYANDLFRLHGLARIELAELWQVLKAAQ